MSETEHKDFFISYNKADRRWAEWIAWHLEGAGYMTVIQAWDFRPGGNFVVQMQEAATQAERTIAVLSPDYLTSSFTQPEWAAAFAQDPTGKKGRLVPVRVRECQPEGLLPQIVYVDLVGRDEAEAKETLLSGIKRTRAKPSVKPAFPGREEAEEGAEAPTFPGALPDVWNVLHNRNPNFTGREGVLEDLHKALRSGQAAALRQTLAGLGGVGKTQLATEYAYRYHTDYEVVWWVRAEEPTTLAGDYALLARELDLPEKDAPDQEVVVQAVRRCLARRGKWLLVFDNASSKRDVHAYLPQGEGGHVVITSRDADWGGVASPLTVRTWEREESVAFLLKRLGRGEAEAAAGALAETLGDLPLALAQAAAYVQASGLSLGAYLALFETRRRELWDEEEPPLSYPDTVGTTWSGSSAFNRGAVNQVAIGNSTVRTRSICGRSARPPALAYA
ncbi:MAG: TIR domain-containing protein [Rhodothermales bacterium]